MGEKNEGRDGTKRGGGGGKANEQKNAHVVVVLKMDLHCGGCEAKIHKFLKKFPGAEKTKVEGGAMKVTVEGKVDPAKLRDKLQEKTKKKVELVSPLPKKEKDQANNEKKEKPKEPPVTTVVLKFSCLHCEGCVQKIHRIITKTKGVLDVVFDRDKDTAAVRGAMDAKALAENLREQMKRAVEIIPPKKEKGGGEAKDKEAGRKIKNACGCCNKAAEIVAGGGGCGKAEGQWMHQYQGACGYGDGYGYVYGEPMHLRAPQLFSDENPNGCAIM